MVATIERVERHHRAKFRRNRSNCGRDMAIFQFFQDLDRPIYDVCVGTTHEGHLVVYHYSKFGWNRCSSFDNMHVFQFREFGLTTPIHVPKLFLGVF